jgi:hypothetical protein
MTAVLPRYKTGPSNYQVATLIFGGQLVEANTLTAGTTDLTVKPATNATAAGSASVLGVAGNDANVIAAQTGAANTYGQPAIDISVLTDYVAVYYGGVDIPVWYSAACIPGQKLVISNTNGCVGPYVPQSAAFAQASGDADWIVGICTNPGGVGAGQLTQQIGGTGGSSFYLGFARIF